MAEATPKLDKKRYRASMAFLQGILSEISETAGQVSTWRCPYKNASDRCTVKFGCRNQVRRAETPSDLPVCAGSDKLDYRGAWDL